MCIWTQPWSEVISEGTGGWVIEKRISELGKGAHRAAPSFICLVWLTQTVVLRLRRVYVPSVRPQLTTITEDSMLVRLHWFSTSPTWTVVRGWLPIGNSSVFPFNMDPGFFTFPRIQCTPLLPSIGLKKGTGMRSVNGLGQQPLLPVPTVRVLVPPS